MKKFFRTLITLLVITSLFSCNKKQNVVSQKSEPTFKSTINNIQKYGNIVLNGTGDDFLKSGFDYGDVVNVNINNADYEIPVVSNYSDVEQGKYLCRVGIDTETKLDSVILAINMGDFATSTGVATKNKIDTDPGFKWDYNIAEPIYATITMKEKAGYYEKYISSTLGLKRSDERADYPNLSDEEFANFRMIKTSNIKDGIIYRSSSPVNPFIKRNKYADAAMRDAKIKSAINLADSQATINEYELYNESYYSTTNVTLLDLSIDFQAKEFKDGIVKAIKFIGENEGPYLVHCNEGKDRAGYMSAIIECMMGATAEEVVKDYMITYYNYYNVAENDDRYNTIKSKNIEDTLKKNFNVDNIYGIDLKKECEEFLISIGLTNSEIEAARNRLQK